MIQTVTTGVLSIVKLVKGVPKHACGSSPIWIEKAKHFEYLVERRISRGWVIMI